MPRTKPFPTSLGPVHVPLRPRRATLAAIALYPACRPGALWMQRAAWIAAAGIGAAALPTRPSRWIPPCGSMTWESLCRQWRLALPEWQAAAVVARRQISRSGFSVLLVGRHDGPVAFVRVRDGGSDRLGEERRVLSALAATARAAFLCPEPLAAGDYDGWAWLAVSALPLRPHRPSLHAPVERIATCIQQVLAPVLPRSGTPEHWRPMHGDLAPWNLRELGSRLLLLDWEEAAWGPPEADIVYYAAAVAALSRRAPTLRPASLEAVTFWVERVARRAGTDAEAELKDALLAALDGMRA